MNKSEAHKKYIELVWHLPTVSNNKEFQRLLRKMDRTKDDRSYVLTSALVLEYRLEQLLLKLLPGYTKVWSNNNLSLSQKIKIVQASELIPNEVFECAIIVRDVRNEFAHDIKVESFGKISSKQKQKMDLYYSRKYVLAKPKSIRKLFEIVVFDCIRAVGLYQMNIEYLRWIMKRSYFKDFMHLHWPKYERTRNK